MAKHSKRNRRRLHQGGFGGGGSVVRAVPIAVQRGLTAAPSLSAEAQYRLGDWDSSLRHAEQAVSLGEDSEQLWILSVLHCMPVLVLAPRGQWVQAERHLRRAEELARLVGDEATHAYLVDAQVHLDVCRGDSSAAIEHAAAVINAYHHAHTDHYADTEHYVHAQPNPRQSTD